MNETAPSHCSAILGPRYIFQVIRYEQQPDLAKSVTSPSNCSKDPDLEGSQSRRYIPFTLTAKLNSPTTSPRVKLWHIGRVTQYHENVSIVLPRGRTSHMASRCSGRPADSTKHSISASKKFPTISHHDLRPVPVHPVFRSFQAPQ